MFKYGNSEYIFHVNPSILTKNLESCSVADFNQAVLSQ